LSKRFFSSIKPLEILTFELKIDFPDFYASIDISFPIQFFSGFAGGQYGFIRLPALREEGEEQPTDHVRVRQGFQTL